jgi:hypothetical protein
MSTRPDSLDQPVDPDRVFYELGIMLDKEDFRAEQDYHRGRLARALAFLGGPGTLAGLEVTVVPPRPGETPPSPPLNLDSEEVHVAPGLALDRIGRLVEVPTMPNVLPGRCIRVKKWLEFQESERDRHEAGFQRSERLRRAFHATVPGTTTPPVAGRLIIDLFLRFAACDRGKTPAFATGAFDALDAVQSARIRDGFEVQLVPRGEENPALPNNYWARLATEADRPRALRELIFGAWEHFRPRLRNDSAANDPVVPDFLDPRNDKHWIFLARLFIPCTDGGLDRPAVRDAGQRIEVHNEDRAFVVTAAALARLLL